MVSEKSLTLGVILPHTKLFGGVKRFFEIGNILVRKGHAFTIFTPDGRGPDWFDFHGSVVALENIRDFAFDALFITEPEYLSHLKDARTALRIFYAVLQRRYIKKVMAKPGLMVMANSGSLYRYLGGEKKKNLVKCIGGIDADKFKFAGRPPKKESEPFVVLAYGRFYRRKKGTSLVVKACEHLYRSGYNLRLLLFDTPVDEQARKKVERFTCKAPFEFFIDHPVAQMAALYHKADLFVSAERNAGWSNTCAEAMACGVPVIATPSGTRDFLIDGETGLVVWRHPWFIQRAMRKLMADEALRARLAVNAREKIEAFSWKRLAANIEEVVLANIPTAE